MQRPEAPNDHSRGAFDLRLIGGLGLGAALMYFLDPARGARRRSIARDKLVHAAHVAEDALGKTGRDVRNRARGAAAVARSRIRPDYAGDEIVVERVRADLGRAVSHPGAVIVTADDGHIVLSGPILDAEADRLLARARKVRGVREVEDRLERHATGDDVPALQGGRPRRGG